MPRNSEKPRRIHTVYLPLRLTEAEAEQIRVVRIYGAQWRHIVLAGAWLLRGIVEGRLDRFLQDPAVREELSALAPPLIALAWAARQSLSKQDKSGR